jgi:ankyrin repeat protein
VIAAAKILIKAGIDINKAGDLGYTPLHVACIKGNLEMVKILINAGADLFALSEGVPPFTAARVAGQDEICELLGSLMRQAQARDPKIRVKSRIAQLRKEITRLEAELAQP